MSPDRNKKVRIIVALVVALFIAHHVPQRWKIKSRMKKMLHKILLEWNRMLEIRISQLLKTNLLSETIVSECQPVFIYLNGAENSGTKCEICSKLTRTLNT